MDAFPCRRHLAEAKKNLLMITFKVCMLCLRTDVRFWQKTLQNVCLHICKANAYSVMFSAWSVSEKYNLNSAATAILKASSKLLSQRADGLSSRANLRVIFIWPKKWCLCLEKMVNKNEHTFVYREDFQTFFSWKKLEKHSFLKKNKCMLNK